MNSLQFIELVKQALTITTFVMIMMLLIEFINVETHGAWEEKLKKSRFGQYLLGVLLGATPGCLGAYTVVSLYAHGVVSFGALVGTMVATSGDEAFVMFSMFPVKATILTVVLIFIGIAAAYTTDKFYKTQRNLLPAEIHDFPLHEAEIPKTLDVKLLFSQLRNISFERALLLFMLIGFLVMILFGVIGDFDKAWIKYTFIGGTIISIIIVAIVSDHFLEEHLWKHVIKKHLLRIFAWTFGALFVVALLNTFFDVNSWVQANLFYVLLIAALIGLIPESGPHLIFVTLFASGVIPFPILLTSSIVQDGHGTLPLLAVTRKGWLILKIINMGWGLAVGGILLLFM
jgi:hypothetical protein